MTTAIGAAAASVVGGGWLRAAAAQSARSARRRFRCATDLSLITGAGSNVVVLRAAGAAALVDSGPPERAAELAKLVRGKLGLLPVELLFNTHWHPDAHGRQRGAALRRHDDRRARAHAPVDEHRVLRRLGRHDVHAARRSGVADANVLLDRSAADRRCEIGDEEIEYGHLPEAHTDGDIYVWFKQRNVLVAGGVVTFGEYPVIDYATGGWIGGLVDATKKLLDIDERRHADRARERARATARRISRRSSRC